MAYDIYPGDDRHPFHVALRESVTGDHLLEALKTLLRSPDWRPGRKVLWDGRHIHELLIEVDEFQHLRRIARSISADYDTGRCALLATREVDHLVAQFFKAALFGQRHEIEVFSSLTAALNWLGSPSLPVSLRETATVAASRPTYGDGALEEHVLVPSRKAK